MVSTAALAPWKALPKVARLGAISGRGCRCVVFGGAWCQCPQCAHGCPVWPLFPLCVVVALGVFFLSLFYCLRVVADR